MREENQKKYSIKSRIKVMGQLNLMNQEKQAAKYYGRQCSIKKKKLKITIIYLLIKS